MDKELSLQLATFPIILEKACRDRAVGMTQMVQFRKAWSAVTAIIMIDPVIMPASNNVKSIPFEFMKSAYPETEWTQPQGNRRAMITTKGYMTVEFARSLSSLVGCTAESEILPGTDILTEALRPPPVYFETDEKDMSGVCCVCMKKGPLGRCPNPKCGLLMHFTCVPPSEKGRNQMCPICREEEKLVETQELPYWHEAEVGAMGTRRKLGPKPNRLSPGGERQLFRPEFPHLRWPTEEEAKTHGYKSIEERYKDSRLAT
jgi:hypothetical protein